MPGSNDITKRRPGNTQYARRLRHDEAEEEYLWSDLRGRRLNKYKFARQIPLEPYVADFLCRATQLVVEIDGSRHSNSRSDVILTEWLNANVNSVLRFWNHEVLAEGRAALETILAALEGKFPERDDVLRFYPPDRRQRISE
jgi:very-short-patch-repair endonuclease